MPQFGSWAHSIGRTERGNAVSATLAAVGAEQRIPETKFAKSGDDRIAYQVFGEGPPDLLWMSAVSDCIDSRWEYPPFASFLRRLASFSRVIMFDRRGTGASDPVTLEALPTWEEWADDALAVLAEAESEQAAILGSGDGGIPSMLFAATHPDRTLALIFSHAWARIEKAEDYPWGVESRDLDRTLPWIRENWGTERFVDFGEFYSTTRKDPEFRRWIAKSARSSCSPREAVSYFGVAGRADIRHVLPAITVPTMVIHRSDAPLMEHSRYLADNIRDSRFISVEGGADTLLYVEPNAPFADAIEEFLLGLQGSTEPDRALAAILYTDIVDSTEQLSAIGDHEWRNLLDTHDAVARTMVEQHRGKIVKMTGDGILATFDGPGRAIRCALSLGEALRPLGLEIRAGLHTGEVELRGTDIAGIGAHIAARVLGSAEPGELLVSAAVPMLVAGSGFKFEDRGEHELKGVPGAWRLFAVQG